MEFRFSNSVSRDIH